MSHASHDLATADWLALWRTLCLDLPLSCAGPSASLADGMYKPSPAYRKPDNAQAAASPLKAKGNGRNRGLDGCAEGFLEELEGCFA
ncbi:hypothetical protein [Methylobacterium flocculans]|uniref:hypothetical protein n=1 Tax=Methylobacterium flocculans TaxID=2984843 RepID=UPI0021F2C439|nr:hypothetical protein [Methylobacterium sp. FF17]